MDLLRSFHEFAAAERLFSTGDRLLLAVSGGMDSTVLCALCHQSGIDFAIAHCNFRLRGAESDRDEAFVRGLGNQYGKEVLVKSFDTSSYAEERKVSLQVAARELRYEWFQRVLDGDPSLAFLATAHHQDDNIETLLMNFFKGTGIAGLRGMLPCNGRIIRPLLFATREELGRFAKENGLRWVEDSSNQSDKYTRNYVRHQLVPLLEQIYPGVLGNLGGNIPRFREIELLYRQAVDEQKKKLLEPRGKIPGSGGNALYIPILKLKKTVPLLTMVYEIIKDFGFTPAQAEAVIGLLDSGSGRYILSATHRILKDRNWLIITPCSSAESSHIIIEAEDEDIPFPGGILQIRHVTREDAGADISAVITDHTGSVAWLDAGSIRYPMLLRKWKTGDYFYPLGMRKKKKLARFFIDKKLSQHEKEKAWVLEMDKKIVWVLGLRIDDRFRVTETTREFLRMTWGETGMR
jgi:tRNA(Ile)-lysidine synthase